MRILHVTDAYLPKQGGIEVQVGDLARRQTAAGHDVERSHLRARRLPDAAARRRRRARGPPSASAGPRRPRSASASRGGRVPAANAQMHAVAAAGAAGRRPRRTSRCCRRCRSSRCARPAARARPRRRDAALAVVARHPAVRDRPRAAALGALAGGLDGRQRAGGAARCARSSARAARSTCCRTASSPRDWAVAPVVRDPAEVVGGQRDAAGVAQAAASPCCGRSGAPARRLPAGVRLRVVVVGDGPLRGRIERAVRRFGLERRRRAARPDGSRRHPRALPPARTSTSPPPCWSRSGSPRSRRAAPASR